MVLISVIVPVYNRKAVLARCLDSIRAHYDNYEVILVDDASTDGSYEAALNYNDPHLKVFKNDQNRGVNYTRNRAIEKAQGSYVTFLDSDDAFLPGAMDIMKEQLEKNEEIQHFLFYDADVQDTKAKYATLQTTYKDWITEKVFGDFTHVLKKEVLIAHPFFEQFRAYEQLNWLRIFKATSPQLVVPVVVKWRDTGREDNLTKALTLTDKTVIGEKFDYLNLFFQMYGNDLYNMDQSLYTSKLQHTILLGMASGRKGQAGKLLQLSPLKDNVKFKWMIRLIPGFILSKLITAKAKL